MLPLILTTLLTGRRKSHFRTDYYLYPLDNETITTNIRDKKVINASDYR